MILSIQTTRGIYMKTLTIGTTNPSKIAQILDALAPAGVLVEGVADKSLLPHVEETGSTVQENARIKALAYAHALGRTILSMDNALFFDELATDKQPGIHVRRIGGGNAVTDEELLRNGVTLVSSLGGRATGYWEYGICVATPDGQLWETSLKTPRIFVSTPCAKVVPGYPLESIQIDPESGKYIAEMTAKEQATFWQRTLGKQLRNFVDQVPF
jgi:XTP/dITP diphosphohydrolase